MLRTTNLEMFKYDWYWNKMGSAANFAQAPYMPLRTCEIVSVFSYGGCAKNAKPRMKYNPQGLIDCYIPQKGKTSNGYRPKRATQPDFVQTKTNYPTSILEFSKGDTTYHPTQKPVALLEYLIRTYTNEGDTVLDNCMGSGSTGVACVNTGRNFIGMEMNDEYYKVACDRIEQAKRDKKKSLL